jgi:hemerythrin-like domain-containing protein
MGNDLHHLSTEELKALRDQLKRRTEAKPKALLRYEHATTADVVRVMGEVTDALITLKTVIAQWQANLDAVGTERLARGDLKPRAIGE